MSDRSGNVVLAFLLGGLVGAGIAMLYAPASGEETRRKIKESMDDAGDWAHNKFADTKDRLSDRATRVKHMVGDKREDLVAAFEAGKDAYQKGREKLMKESG